MNLGENIYKLRTEKNMSQGDLADALEVSRQSVSKWENNSAVPELDKLIKMAQIFGVTIDELVTGNSREAATETVQPQEKIIYVERPIRPVVTAPQILGTLLLFLSVFAAVFSAIFRDAPDLDTVLPLVLPVALCGMICLVAKQPIAWCSWVIAGGYWVYFFILSNHWEDQGFLVFLGLLFVAGALIYTICLHQTDRIHIPAWGWGLILLILFLAAVLLFINLSAPMEGFAQPPVPVTPYANEAAP